MQVGGQRQAPPSLFIKMMRFPLYSLLADLMASLAGSEDHVTTEIRFPDRKACSQSLVRLTCLIKLIWFIQILLAVKL
jgi:hypothetical protein